MMHITRVVRVKITYRRCWKRFFNVVIFITRTKRLIAANKDTRLTAEEADEIRRRFRSYSAQFGCVTPLRVGSFFRYIGVNSKDDAVLRLVQRMLGADLTRAADLDSALAKLALNITQVLKVAQQLKREQAQSSVSDEELAFEAVMEVKHNINNAAAESVAAISSIAGHRSSMVSSSAGPTPTSSSSSSATSVAAAAAAALAAKEKAAKDKVRQVGESEVHDCLTSFGISPLITSNDAVPATMQFAKFRELFFQGGAAIAANKVARMQLRRRRSIVAFNPTVMDDSNTFNNSMRFASSASLRGAALDDGADADDQQQVSPTALNDTVSANGGSARSSGEPVSARNPDMVAITITAAGASTSTATAPGASSLSSKKSGGNHALVTSASSSSFSGQQHALLDEEDDEDDDDETAASSFMPDASAMGARSVRTSLALLLGSKGGNSPGKRARHSKAGGSLLAADPSERIARQLRSIRVKMDLPPQLQLDAAPVPTSREMEGWREFPELQKMTAAKNRFDAESETGKGTGVRVLPTKIGRRMIAEAAKFRAQVTKVSDDAIARAAEKFVKTPSPSRRSDAALAGAYRRSAQDDLIRAEYLESRKQKQRELVGSGSRIGQLKLRSSTADDDEDDDGHGSDRKRRVKWLANRKERFVPFMSRPIPRSDVSKQLSDALGGRTPTDLCRTPAFLLSQEQRSQIGARMMEEQGKLSHALVALTAQHAVHSDARMAASMALNHLEQRQFNTNNNSVSSASFGVSAPPQPSWATGGGGGGGGAYPLLQLPPRPNSTPI